MRLSALGGVTACLVLLAACGASSPAEFPTGDIPITQRAVAAVALDTVPQDTTSREASYTGRDNPKGALGADLHYRRGDTLTIFVSPTIDQDPCPDFVAGCVRRDVDGGTLILSWAEEEPEEDPGFVSAVMQRKDQSVTVTWSGDSITGDPRQQKLGVSVEALEEVARDPRLGLTTSQQTVDAGQALKRWDGGEPDPTAYDQVPSTDQALINSYWSAHGGYGAFHRRESSPLKKEFGPGAVGGRFTADGDTDAPAQTIDVLASPQAPGWLAEDPCDTKRFADHCVAHSKGRYFAWVPGPSADGGEVWMFEKRKNEIVAIRKSAFTVPEDQEEARLDADWYFADSYLSSSTLGLRTDKILLKDLNFESE